MRMSRGMQILILLLLAATVSADNKPAVTERAILGDWCAGSATAFHEEFTLSVEDGKHLFASWLHQRPAVSGTWTLSGRTLTIQSHAGQDYVCSVLSATSRKHVIQAEGEQPETYVRKNCREFEAPPRE